MNRIKSLALNALALAVLVGAVMPPRGAEGSSMVGASPQVTAEISAIYQNSADSINRDLAKAVATLKLTPAGERDGGAEFRAARAKALLDEVRNASRAATGRSVKVFTKAAQDSYKQGADLAAKQARDLGLGDRLTATEGSFTGINRSAVEAIARDSVARLQAKTDEHAENAVTLFRSLSASMAVADPSGKTAGKAFSISEPQVNRVIAEGLVSGDPRRALRQMRELVGNGAGFSDDVIENYRQVGNQQITVGGWTGKLRTYTEMVVRTRTAEAQAEGQIERQMSVGLDLGQITGSNSENFCTEYVGLVVVVRGPARDGYIAISDLPGGKVTMHPNCTKTITAYAQDLVSEGRVRLAELAQNRYAAAQQKRAA